jgi:hypothetical protein
MLISLVYIRIPQECLFKMQISTESVFTFELLNLEWNMELNFN